ncbi:MULTISPECIES: M48 family metalloprotease [Rhodomicrobium]|uniref:M48 family metalloprotease n=1 Tax=Rhodomicrobium TaxID=1068 RepID=UPI001FDAB06F|nr:MULTISPECIES: M48 family metalloprotease [Rhodomicrobium]
MTSIALVAVLLAAQTAGSFAAGLIRDAEIEELMNDYATPIFRAANLSTQNVNIHIVNDKSFNAFVIDGQNMFIHTGAITRSETPNQLIGVIAHEAGHIAGGHLARLKVQISRMQSAALIMNLIGIGAMIGGAVSGGGNDVGEAGAAVLYGGSALIQRSILSYRRVEESSADQAAVSFLNRTKQSTRGMLETFRQFADQSLGSAVAIDPYIQSHPMPQDRIAQLRDLAERSPYFNQKDSPALQFRHDMVRAKLEAFTNKNNAAYVFRQYPEKDQTLPARYARAICRYFSSGAQRAVADLDSLIAEQPNNPYFYELKGQFLLESGKVRDSIPPLRKAVSLSQSGLMKVMLGQALVATEDPGMLKEAIAHLQQALVKENQSVVGYRQLAIAYGRLNRVAEAQLASAQSFFFEGNADFAKVHAERAIRAFPEGSPNWVKANDIISDVDTYRQLAKN